MEELLEQFKNWTFLAGLPEESYGCRCIRDEKLDNEKYFFFSYHREDGTRWTRAYYDFPKKSYFMRIGIGLLEFNDISYFSQSLSEFEALLRSRLDKTLEEFMTFVPEQVGVAIQEKKLLQWPYAEQLPEEISGFKLLLSPKAPAKVINGSYLILDYSDLVAQTSLVLYYNVYRDEFFGELRVQGLPELVNDFDAKTLTELEQKLEKRLTPVLEALRQRLEKEQNP
jgi:hypothetical protein